MIDPLLVQAILYHHCLTITFSHNFSCMHHHLQLNVSTRSDPHWCKYFLEHWNGMGLMTLFAKCPSEYSGDL